MLGNAYILLLVATLGWGGNAVAGKFATGGWEPFTLTCIRWLVVVLVLLPFSWRLLVHDRKLIAEQWRFFVVAGISMSLFNLLMFLALNYTSAINVSIEQASMPIFIILANFFILHKRVTTLQILGVLISVLGVVVITSHGELLNVFKQGLNLGDAVMLLACMFYAGYTFILRWRPPVHWLSFMCVVALVAFFTAIPFVAFEVRQVGLQLPSSDYWLLLLYIALVPSIISQLSFAKSVELIGGNRAGLFINLVPVFGSFLAVFLLGEQFLVYHAIGMVFVIGGILLAERFALAEN